MSEKLSCVFLPPSFKICDCIAVVRYEQSQPEPSSLKIVIDDKTYDLGEPIIAGNKISWMIDEAGDFQEIAPECTQFTIKSETEEKPIDLKELRFLGPAKDFSLINDVYLLEFTSGIYANSPDVKSETISFHIDSILTLDYRNVQTIKQQLEELNTAQATFDDTKRRLESEGINLEELASLKEEYEKCMHEKRRVQHEFLHQNQRMQAAMIHSQAELDREAAIEALQQHIEENRQKSDPPETTLEDQNQLLQFRLAALAELKTIFPLDFENAQLCGVTYTQSPTTPQQWNETRAFCGFATHYIREVSRVVGIPLQFLLIPLASYSTIICRLTDKKRQIPADMNQQGKDDLASYEASLISCIQHMAKILLMEVPQSNSLLDFLQLMSQIDQTNLQTLIPESAQ